MSKKQILFKLTVDSYSDEKDLKALLDKGYKVVIATPILEDHYSSSSSTKEIYYILEESLEEKTIGD